MFPSIFVFCQALTDPYFKGLSKPEREPSCQPIRKMEFDFEHSRVSKDDIRELIFQEILEYHLQLLNRWHRELVFLCLYSLISVCCVNYY